MREEQFPACSVKCRYCDILLVGREQFIGHMFHTHEFSYEQLRVAWESIAAHHLNVQVPRRLKK